MRYGRHFKGWFRAAAACFALGLASAPTRAADLPDQQVALGGQCALGWVYGHRILTDCSITWLDARNDHTYCFTTRTARERFVKAAQENIERAQGHFRAAHDAGAGSAAAASDTGGL